MNIRDVFLTLVHKFTKERRTVPVTYVSPTRFTIRWGIAGTYEIAVRDGLLIGARAWSIEDLDEARRVHQTLMKAQTEEQRKSIFGSNWLGVVERAKTLKKG